MMMISFINYLLIGILLFYIFIFCVKPLFSKDKSLFWNPITFILVVYFYYVIMPFFSSEANFNWLVGDYHNGETALLSCVVLSVSSTIVGFKVKYKNWLKDFNSLIHIDKVVKYALILFFIGLASYVPFRGFNLSMATHSDSVVYEQAGAFDMYFVNLVALIIVGCALSLFAVLSGKKRFLWLFVGILWIAVVTFVFSGFRFRLVILAVALASVYHLYPVPRKIRLEIWIPIAIVFYIFMGIMDKTRSYSNGLDFSRLEGLTTEEKISGAGENKGVYVYSCLVMDKGQSYPLTLFDPVWRAVTMPFPRALFPWKPEVEHYSMQDHIFGYEFGCAYIMPVDNWISLRWFGVIIYGLFMGYLCSIFWNNYRQHPTSISAILLLALFNGFTYTMISRGYLAQVFMTFMFFVIVPFWIIILFKLGRR